MKKIEGNKMVALLLSAVMVTSVLAACSINTDELSEGIFDIGNAFATQKETPAPSAEPEETVSETEKETTEATETTEPSETTAETTVKPTPSPTPMPQRVDFSGYENIDLLNGFTVTEETFEESAHAQDKENTVLATFKGSRVVITKAPSDNVRDSINLVIDGFYAEAAGVYKKAASNAQYDFNMNGVSEKVAEVNVSFVYSTNGRALTVIMIYEVKGTADDTTVIDFANFDMISGQYITLDAISKDAVAFEKALGEGIKYPFVKRYPKAAENPATDEQDAEPVSTEKSPLADAFDKFFIAPGDKVGANFYADVYGIKDGAVYVTTVAIDDYAQYLNRYGRSVFYYDYNADANAKAAGASGTAETVPETSAPAETESSAETTAETKGR